MGVQAWRLGAEGGRHWQHVGRPPQPPLPHPPTHLEQQRDAVGKAVDVEAGLDVAPAHADRRLDNEAVPLVHAHRALAAGRRGRGERVGDPGGRPRASEPGSAASAPALSTLNAVPLPSKPALPWIHPPLAPTWLVATISGRISFMTPSRRLYSPGGVRWAGGWARERRVGCRAGTTGGWVKRRVKGNGGGMREAGR